MSRTSEAEMAGRMLAKILIGKGFISESGGTGFDMSEKELLIYIAAFVFRVVNSPENVEAHYAGLEAVREYRRMQEGTRGE